MCGIIGISSNKSVSASIINSLKKLEYRGYDSAGIATLSKNIINEVKSEGRVENLEKNFDLKSLSGNIGIGHVRWATHGIPNSINAHPHSSHNVSVVHNGIIENSTLLKKYLVSKGHDFKSQTDTEVIVHLITENLKTAEIQEAITKTLKQLHGSFALGIIFKDMSDLIIGARRGSPLAVGYGPNENYLGSDSYALKSMTNKITYLDDGEFCIVKKDEVTFFNEEGKKINKKVLELSSDQENYDKGDFKHFMAKEIEEQPETLKTGIKEYLDNINNDINIYNFPWKINEIKAVILIGCGTAYHSCLMAKYWFEELTSLDVNIDIASEFRYRKNRFKKDTLYVFVSQSGETADTYAALDLCNKNDMKTCAVVNVIESSIARDSNFVLPIHCGPEIGVASTKAFLGQILILYILSLKLSSLRKEINTNLYEEKIKDLKELPALIEKTLLTDNDIQSISTTFNEAKGSMFLGRGFSYPIALEGALKLKELSYVHAEGYPAGEMKHGPLALIEKGMPVVVLAPRDSYYKKTISNMQEVIARGAKVLLITNKSKDEVVSENIWETIEVENTNDDLLPFLLTIPLQKLAYYSALKKGHDIDKPRNLAKSVTVE
ncbi:glutamine--fructose-6-phosphate transaminase (isomerizing) [Candidatus Pelagibacter bacterium nBUS_44]|uniref:glutamine--fructose-6-phosphate transaminase (isomerizing) n=1 Tax=Candidatus Pelagibacter bacterium nBUS_44 TaxID=3374195 RepID=UPI003EBDD6F6